MASAQPRRRVAPFIIMSFELIQGGEKRTRENKDGIPELPHDVKEKIFEESNCQVRAQLCKTNKEFAEFCRSESHKEKCNPNSKEAVDVRNEFQTVMREIIGKSPDLNSEWLTGYSVDRYIDGSFALEIFDPRKFANFLAAEENWNLVKKLLTLEGPVRFYLKCSSHAYTDADTYDQQQRFRIIMGFVSVMTIRNLFSFDDISLFLKYMNPRVVTHLEILSDDEDFKQKMPIEDVKRIETMQNLRTLILRGTLIEDGDLQLVHMSKLKHLNLSGNKFSRLHLREMVNLEELNLEDNQLARLDLTSNTHLERLHLSKNRITELVLPPKIEGPSYDRERDGMIKSWDLSHNLLTELPKNFWKIFNTYIVRLQHNRLTSLHFDDFPPESRIQHFSINGNKLSSLPEWFIEWVKKNTRGYSYACETIDFRDNDDLPIACYPQARNIIADMKTMGALLNNSEQRQKYVDLWLYEGDTLLGKFEFEFSWRRHDDMPFNLDRTM